MPPHSQQNIPAESSLAGKLRNKNQKFSAHVLVL